MLRLSGVPPGPIMLNTVQMYNKGAVGGPCWGAGQLCLIDIRSLVLHVVVLVCCLGTSGQTHPPTHSHQLGVNIPPNYQISESPVAHMEIRPCHRRGMGSLQIVTKKEVEQILQVQ